MFDLERFENHEFFPRTKRVGVKALAHFFADDAEPVIEVRGLNSDELHSAMEAGSKAKSVEAVIQALSDHSDQVAKIREAIGLGNGTPAEVRKRIEMLVHGSVTPKMSHLVAAKLAENFPIEFMQLTNEITELTGLGADMEKPEAA